MLLTAGDSLAGFFAQPGADQPCETKESALHAFHLQTDGRKLRDGFGRKPLLIVKPEDSRIAGEVGFVHVLIKAGLDFRDENATIGTVSEAAGSRGSGYLIQI